MMEQLDEKLKLTDHEKDFLKRVVNHWKKTNSWFVCTGDSKSWTTTGTGRFDTTDKLASRSLVLNDLLEVQMLPSATMLITQMTPKVVIGDTSFSVPQHQTTNEQNFFDWMFKPTKKGLDHCFVEEL